MESCEHGLWPSVWQEKSLDGFIGTATVNVRAVASILETNYGRSPEEVGQTVILFAADVVPSEPRLDGVYDSEDEILELMPITDDAPEHVLNPPDPRNRHRYRRPSVDAYFEQRSAELSRTLAGLLVYRAARLGYESQEMRELHDGRRLLRGLGHGAVAGAAAYGLYRANEMGLLDNPVGLGLTGGALLALVGVDLLGMSVSHERERDDRRDLVARHALEAYQAAPTDLVRVTPPNSR